MQVYFFWGNMNFKSQFNSKTISLILLATLIGPFNNCSKIKSGGQLDLTSLSPEQIETSLSVGKKLYTTNCASCHGQIELTGKAGVSAEAISVALSTIPQMSFLAGLTNEEIDLISLALKGPSQIVTVGEKTLYACDPNLTRTSTILKLSNREFSLALSNLLNDFSSNTTSPLSADTEFQNLIKALPTDLTLSKYTTQENSFLLSSGMVSGFFAATYRAAVLVSTAGTGLANYPNTSSCLGAATITQSCHQSFVKELSSRAFRRNLSTADANALAATIWNQTLAKADLLLETFATVASYPDFIYKDYSTGVDDATLARTVQISGVELANKLAFYLTGGPANLALRTLAASGGLENAATFKTEVDRLITSSAGQTNLKRLFRESYGYDVNADLQYNPAFLGTNSTTNLQSAMIQELDYFFTDEVISKKSRFQDLMTSKNSLVTNSALGQIYGVTANSTVGTTLPAERSGFLTRAAFLTKKSGYYTSPIKRGLHVMERVLCSTVGDPPANAPTTVSEAQVVGQLASTRTRYEGLTQQPNTTCVGCHSKVNPYGFAFEGFDSLGRKRTVESIFNTTTNQQLGSAQLNTVADVKINNSSGTTRVIDASDLVSGLATSDMAMMCLTKHLKTFDTRQAATSQDYCHMNESLNTLYGTSGNQGSVYDAIIAYVTSKEFRKWRY